MDGLSLSAVVHEIGVLAGGRIEKVQQPERDELLISVHSAGGSCRLLISASPENGRITLTDERKPSPAEAPAFLMLLRKHLTGAKIVSVRQPNMDRIVELELETTSELRDKVPMRLVIEIMGRHSNIILVDDNGMIVDSIRRVGPSLSSARLVLPRIAYEYPPSKKKLDPRTAGKLDFAEVLDKAVRPESALSETFYGLSPAVAKKLICSLGYPACGVDKAAEKLERFYSDFSSGSISPCIVTADGAYICTLPFIPADGEFVRFTTMSEAINAFYSGRAADESIKRRTSAYEKTIKSTITKLERKMELFTDSISSESENEKLRLWGELITANLYAIPARASSVVLSDYYTDPPSSVEIPLDPLLSPSENAQRYYTKYRKAKLSREYAIEMSAKTADEIAYLEELLYTLSCCDSESELNEIRAELAAGGYIKEDSGKGRKRTAAPAKLPPSKPHSFITGDGFTVLVGKNNRQNDKLTFGTAAPDDVWLHVKDFHGSHVIVRCGGSISDRALYDAAMLAAYHSKARGSANVPVDYTSAKYVKKPSGSKPGMVIYTHQHTVFVTPDKDYVEKMQKK